MYFNAVQVQIPDEFGRCQHVLLRFAWQTQNDVGTDLDAPIAGSRDRSPETGDIMPPVNPLQSSVVDPPQSLKNTVGNAELEPQQTTIYELGLQQQLSSMYGLTFTVYFKDIRNLVGTEVYETIQGIKYGRYINPTSLTKLR